MNNDNKEKSVVLSLEYLNKLYQNLLTEYQQAVADYISYLQQNDNQQLSKINDSFTYIKGQSFWGTNSIKSFASNSLQQCSATCSTTAGCSGATFNPDKNMCWLRKGDGQTIPALSNDYAIVHEGKHLLMKVYFLNKQLSDINKKIQYQLNNSTTLYNDEVYKRKEYTKQLVQNFSQLLSEREKIKEVVNDYEKLNKKENEGSIMINQNYYSFILLLFLVIIVIIILFLLTSKTPAPKTTFISPIASLT